MQATIQNASIAHVDVQYPIMESFYTIQGEGVHAGKAAWFIRLAGCDVGCVWCDVKDSWDASSHPKLSLSQIAQEANQQASKLVVVTGGEPLMYDLAPLTKELKSKGLILNIETSGVYPVTGEWDWICFSPKKFKKPHVDIYKKAQELKVVIYNKSDFMWAEQHAALVNDNCRLLLQPEWSKQKEMMPLIVEYVKNNPHWEISLQTHKFMDIP